MVSRSRIQQDEESPADLAFIRDGGKKTRAIGGTISKGKRIQVTVFAAVFLSGINFFNILDPTVCRKSSFVFVLVLVSVVVIILIFLSFRPFLFRKGPFIMSVLVAIVALDMGVNASVNIFGHKLGKGGSRRGIVSSAVPNRWFWFRDDIEWLLVAGKSSLPR